MKIHVESKSVVYWRCAEPGCDEIHDEVADYVNDANGWLFYVLAEPDEDQDPAARLLPMAQVVRVDFLGPLVFSYGEGVSYTREVEEMDPVEVEATALNPTMFTEQRTGGVSDGRTGPAR